MRNKFVLAAAIASVLVLGGGAAKAQDGYRHTAIPVPPFSDDVVPLAIYGNSIYPKGGGGFVYTYDWAKLVFYDHYSQHPTSGNYRNDWGLVIRPVLGAPGWHRLELQVKPSYQRERQARTDDELMGMTEKHVGFISADTSQYRGAEAIPAYLEGQRLQFAVFAIEAYTRWFTAWSGAPEYFLTCQELGKIGRTTDPEKCQKAVEAEIGLPL